jgi:hypothetical protein
MTLIVEQSSMGTALRELVLRGAISLTLCAMATLLVFKLLSVLAEHLPSKAPTADDFASAGICNPSSCVTKAKRRGR